MSVTDEKVGTMAVLTMNDRAMREHVLRLVRKTIADHGLPARPTVTQVVAALGLPAPKDGRLSGQDGARTGRQIIISDRMSCIERREFTAFHEILHILIEEDGEILSELHEHFYNSNDRELDWKLEELCQVGAAEFVLPAALFRDIMRGYGWKLAGIEQAARACSSSMIAAAFQYAHHSPDPCTVLICEPGVPPLSAAPGLDLGPVQHRSGLFVAYTPRHPDSYPMCRHAVIPSDHLIHRVWQDGSAADGEAAGFFRSRKGWPMPCEVAPIRGRVYAALFKREPRRAAAQLPLFEPE